MRLRNKKGQVSIIIMMICSSMVLMMVIFIGLVKDMAVDQSVESLGRLWASSMLGEYDLNLFERYGLLGFYGSPEEVDEKLDNLISYSFDEKSYIDYGGLRSSMAGYELNSEEIFISQLRKATYTEAVSNFGKKGERDYDYPEAISDKAIINRRILDSLPSSKGTDDSLLDYLGNYLSGISNIGDVVDVWSNAYIQSYYIKSHFGHALNIRDDAYLEYEMEYILCGKKRDRDNFYGTRNRIIALREVLNFAYINANPRMYEETLLAAEIIAPGPAALAVQQALIAAWAFAESVNDYRLLIHGIPVPYIKDEASWAVKLESVIEYSGEGYIDPGAGRGEYYDDYIFSMTFLLGESTRVRRTMDLIEIDMKKNCYKDFSLADYYAGVEYEIVVNGKKHSFRDGY